MLLDTTRFDALTFDCYGTLIDWESGILSALRPLAERHAVHLGDDELLEAFGAVEHGIQEGSFRIYREVLEAVVVELGRQMGFEPTDEERRSLWESIAHWPPFPDTVAALRRLKRRYRLAIVSNIDDALFAGSARHLQVPFDEVVTAQQVGSYKPAPAHFHTALQRLALPVERVLHVAQSLFHDVAPARALGFTTVWVNRRAGRAGSGATPPARATPDLEVPDLRTLAELLVPELLVPDLRS